MTKRLLTLFAVAVVATAAASGALATSPGQQTTWTVLPATSSQQSALLDEYCVTCHNEDRLETGGVPFAFEDLDLENVGVDAEMWEKVVEKRRLGMMPPAGSPRPDRGPYDQFVTRLETELDRAAAASPNPGRPAVRRLTTAEYINAVRSLVSFEIDERSLLFPADDVDEEGFATNGDVLSISPALFDRYLSVANRVSRLAVGDPTIGPGYAAATYSTPRLLYQDDRMSESLPFGSRGGMAISHYFPLDGEYEVRIRLRRMIYDYVVGMGSPQEIEVRLDGALVKRFTVGDADRFGYPSAYSFFGTIRGDVDWEEYVSRGADAGLVVRFLAEAGMHVVGVSFVEARTEPTGVLERRASGFSLSGMGFYLDNAAVGRVEINGPHDATGPGDTPSRRVILSCTPTGPADEEPCARQILTALARRAYRRPATTDDVQTLMTFYEAGRRERGFENGIQKALERLLVAPEFLFRIERDPVGIAPGTAYRLNDLELASRLSFFLWSSIPDVDAVEALLAAGARVNAKEFSERQSALMWAVAQRHPAVVRLLIEHGADVQARSTVRRLVISRRLQSELKYGELGRSYGTDAQETDVGGFTPLLFAARHGDIESARLLLAAGASINDTAPDGSSVLVVAVYSSHGALAKFLLEQGANPNAAAVGYAALHAAVMTGDLDVVEALLAHGARPNAQVTEATKVTRNGQVLMLDAQLLGATPFALAAKYTEVEIMRVLAAGGADAALPLKNGWTPLMLAASAGWRYGVWDRRDRVLPRELATQAELVDAQGTWAAVQVAIEAGADVTAVDAVGNTALHHIVDKGFDRAVELLVESGANVNSTNNRGQTPLAIVARARSGNREAAPGDGGAAARVGRPIACTPSTVTSMPSPKKEL